MKKLLSGFSISLLFLLVACNSEKMETKGDEMRDKNLAASHIVNEAFKTGDISKIDEAIASDFVDHTDRGDMNRDSLKTMIQMVHKEFPDMKSQVVKEIADSEYVFTLMRWTGNSNGQMGMPVGPYDMQAIEVVRFRDGKAVEHWSYMQPQDVVKMMGQMPAEETKK
ncbi:MAG: hypothetical protein GC171_11590 [Terrimonas sp.]|nr:hypothetical protein [Terrimonas sp.]